MLLAEECVRGLTYTRANCQHKLYNSWPRSLGDLAEFVCRGDGSDERPISYNLHKVFVARRIETSVCTASKPPGIPG